MAADLWWGMFTVAALVLIVVVALWIYALCRAPRTYDAATQRRIARRWIIGGGIVLPTVTVVTLLAFGIPMGHRMLPLPDERAFRIDVTAHQWWWEVRYPDHGITSTDHLVIPAGRPIDVHVTSADVIHSFWIPRLGGKIDVVPGRTNVLRLQADEPGRYRGQCAEFCGAHHAHMVFTVDALDPDAFDDWLQGQLP